MGFLNKIFKSYSEKEVKRVMPLVEKINSLEPEMEKLSDEELRAKTAYFKGELANGKTLDDILPETFAVMREASKRVLGMRHFDVQLIGGIILHQGRIAEMKTGEGKTLVATLPVYLNALEGKGVHVITVNEYLARRDSEWMGKVYRFLGLSVGLVLGQQESSLKREAYNADITYCTNSELGFDYLRDNMVVRKEDMVQRGTHYAILDEIDSILIDEARTPLIISGMSQNKTSDLYKKADSFVKRLEAKTIVEDDVKNVEQTEDNENYDYIIDLKAKTAALTGKGIEKAEKYFNLENYNDLENSDIVHNVTQALRANGIMKKDIDYIVKDGEVLIVDEFTGRIMYGRRYSDGLHQAIEAKEGVKIADESRTLATITYQNFFRLYDKLAGMTGTAMTEEDEFREIYHLDVIAIPTNRPLIRKDEVDAVYKNENAKYAAIVNDIKACHEKGQPVLVGTVSIEKSEKLSNLLQREGLKHEVLNAKNHEKEAEIIAQAGKFGAVTIATNMAGRGTDIMLGGNSEYLAKQEMRKLKYSDELVEQATAFNETSDEEILEARKKFKELKEKHENEIAEEKAKVIEVGGLRIIGTERHESRRIDNQLRGRSGRQGDPGSTMFYLALDDNLLKIFGGDLISSLVNTDKIPDDQPFQVGLLGKTIERAQSRVEGQHFSARKYILSYDDVINVQREIIYRERRQVLDGTDIRDNIVNMLESACELVVETYSADMSEENFNKAPLINEIRTTFNMPQEEIAELKELNKDNINPVELASELQERVIAKYEAKEQEIGPELREFERHVMLMIVDSKWMDHIDAMDELKNGIGLRAYGQKDPVIQYRIEGADMFDEMISKIKVEVAQYVLHVSKKPINEPRVSNVRITNTRLDTSAIDTITPVGESAPNKTSDSKPQPIVNNGPKVGRNDPCPCRKPVRSTRIAVVEINKLQELWKHSSNFKIAKFIVLRRNNMKCSKDTMLLYAVTNSKLPSKLPLMEQVEAALKGGITCLQLREKDLSDEAFLARAIEMQKLCKRYNVPLIINDNVKVAIQSGASGIHVGQSDMPLSEVRKLVGENMIIGVSAHNVEEAKAAEAGGADYLGVGAIYATTTKPDATYVPVSELKRICKAVRIPVVAIGGMERGTISKLSGTGVDGVAMVSAIFAADNIEQECRRLLRLSKDMVYEMER